MMAEESQRRSRALLESRVKALQERRAREAAAEKAAADERERAAREEADRMREEERKVAARLEREAIKEAARLAREQERIRDVAIAEMRVGLEARLLPHLRTKRTKPKSGPVAQQVSVDHNSRASVVRAFMAETVICPLCGFDICRWYLAKHTRTPQCSDNALDQPELDKRLSIQFLKLDRLNFVKQSAQFRLKELQDRYSETPVTGKFPCNVRQNAERRAEALENLSAKIEMLTQRIDDRKQRIMMTAWPDRYPQAEDEEADDDGEAVEAEAV